MSFELVGSSDPLIAAADALIADDRNWRLVQSAGCLTATREWPDGTIDTVVLFGTGTGHAIRQDADGNATAWSVKGSLVHVVNDLLTVPVPDAPDAHRGSGSVLPRGEGR